MTEHAGPNQLRRRVEEARLHATTITAVHEVGGGYQTYLLRFSDPVGGQQSNILQTVMNDYDGPQDVTYSLDPNNRRLLTVTFIGGDNRFEGLAWLHDVFRPHVAYTAALELREEGNHLAGRLVFLNPPMADDLDQITAALQQLDVVKQAEASGAVRLIIHFRDGATTEDITAALRQQVAFSRRVSVCVVEPRRERRN